MYMENNLVTNVWFGFIDEIIVRLNMHIYLQFINRKIKILQIRVFNDIN